MLTVDTRFALKHDRGESLQSIITDFVGPNTPAMIRGAYKSVDTLAIEVVEYFHQSGHKPAEIARVADTQLISAREIAQAIWNL